MTLYEIIDNYSIDHDRHRVIEETLTGRRSVHVGECGPKNVYRSDSDYNVVVPEMTTIILLFIVTILSTPSATTIQLSLGSTAQRRCTRSQRHLGSRVRH